MPSNIERGEFEHWIEALREDIREGFKVTHQKQDYTNGRVRAAEQDIAILKDRAEQATLAAKSAAAKSAVSGASAGAIFLGLLEFLKWAWGAIYPHV